MSVSSELPTVVSKPPKTRTKLPIYLIAAIVVALVVAVVVINIVHRLPDAPDDEDVKKAVNSSSTSESIASSEETDSDDVFTTRETVLVTTTVGTSSSSTSEDSSSSSSDEEHVDAQNGSLVQVTVTSTVGQTTNILETTTVTQTDVAVASTTENTLHESTSEPTSSENLSGVTSESHSETTVIPVTSVECGKTCSISVVESIPRGVWFSESVHTKNAFDSWAELLGTAEREIDIFAYKMNLRGMELRYDVDNSTFEGRQLYGILEKQARNGVEIKLIDCQPPTSPANDIDANELQSLGLIERRGLDMNRLNGGGGGVQHSKTFVVDDRHLFVGSMNFEWKSFSQKLEIGLEFHDCACIAADASRLFDQVFSSLSGHKTLELVDFPVHRIGNSSVQFLASPSFLLGSSSSWDLEALLNLIYEADEFVDLAVMQYFPSWIYFKNREFFSQIDNAIRMSVSRGIRFRILVSGDDKEEQKLMFSYLHSLSVLHSPTEKRFIQVKYIMIPQTAQESYKDRKMHAKFMLSESRSFVGSSNYAPEYFYKSSGTAVLVDEEAGSGEINQQLRAVFGRYWHSSYSQPLQKYGELKGFLPKTSKPSNPFSGWFGFDQIGIFNEKYSASGFVYEKDQEDSILDPIIFI